MRTTKAVIRFQGIKLTKFFDLKEKINEKYRAITGPVCCVLHQF